MGNTSSSSKGDGHSAANSPNNTNLPSTTPRQQKTPGTTSKRRESVPTATHGRSTAAPPSASLESAHRHSTSHAASNTPTAQPQQSHTRQRSQTSVDPAKQPSTTIARPQGIQDSRPADRIQQSQGEVERLAPLSTITNPEPQPAPEEQIRSESNRITHAGLPSEVPDSPASYYVPSTQYNRPPRLPLPIEEEILLPGSPIMSPADFSSVPIDEDNTNDNSLARNASVHSSHTIEDEQAAEDDFQTHGRATGQMFDTLVEWKEGGDRVYVTGSFSGWNKKHRLHKHGPSTDFNALSALIPLVVGAHHMTFLVDGTMRTSKFLPTAVDYTNVLINYVEVPPSQAPRLSAPVDIQRPGQQKKALTTEHHGAPPDHESSQALPPPTPDLKPTHKSGVPSAGPSIASSAVPLSGTEQPSNRSTSMTGSSATTRPRRVADSKTYHSEIPQFLEDLDANEHNERYERANATTESLPAPPALPSFLSKNILNSTLPMKDDASVLVMPNYTVLNHLATTSIKSKILATSATTRYKRKYVTTILYRPTKGG